MRYGCAVDRTPASISNRSREFIVCATAEATSVVETRVQQNVELPRMPVDAPAKKRVYFEVSRQVSSCWTINLANWHCASL